MDIDLLIERLLDIRKQGASRIFFEDDIYCRKTKRIRVDRDKDGDAILFGE